MLMLKQRIGGLLSGLDRLREKEAVEITGYEYAVCKKSVQMEEISILEWKPFPYAMEIGGEDNYYYFRTKFNLPDSYKDQKVIYRLQNFGGVKWDTVNPQFACYVNGLFYQGLDENHESILLSEKAEEKAEYEIILMVYTGLKTFHSRLKSHIAVLDAVTEKYYYDIKVPYETAILLEEKEKKFTDIILCLNESLNKIDLRNPYSPSYYESLTEAQSYISREFYEKRCGNAEAEVYCIGHTHIDIAWLWTLEVAKDKAVRSFGTVLKLMEQYPEYHFMSSQPHLYKAVKERAPRVYEEIKKRVAEGRWEPEGSMFVEADCNLTSGESLVRQFVKGKQFFAREFQKSNEILWLPDVFGYSAALPQIMNKCHVKYFMTTKISWNEFNQMPYDTFLWEGIDGTEVLTHFIPASDYDKSLVSKNFFTTYNGMLDASQIKGAWQRYQQKYLNSEVLFAYGYGDGGGGPTGEMLEHQRRLSAGIPGCPKTKQSNAIDFFRTLEKKVQKQKYLPKWSGELYLEYHRGTYTSMARNKKLNRKSEFLLHNIEMFSAINEALLNKTYPVQQLEDLWEILLRNQFHDILPGSSIEEVYENSLEEYKELTALGKELLEKALGDLTEAVDANAGDVVVYNPNGFKAHGYVEIAAPAHLNPQDCLISDGQKNGPVQMLGNGNLLFYANDVPTAGYKTFHMVKKINTGEQTLETLRITDRVMENQYLRILFNAKGQFASIYDKQNQREVLKPGQCGNVLMSYEDRPHNWDAWDINNYYIEKSWEIDEISEMKMEEEGDLRICMKITRPYLKSQITQFIYLSRDEARIDVKNVIDWKEEHVLVKALFPVDIHSSEAVYEIQYGNVKRATHSNTSWDYAKFEVCHHKWLDYSEDGYGVSLLNDCKYGCNIQDGVIGLSLLKSATSPNPAADKEIHEFTYSLYPHRGDFKEAKTAREAYLLNNSLLTRVKGNTSGKLPQEFSAVTVSEENIMLEVIKAPERIDDLQTAAASRSNNFSWQKTSVTQVFRLYEYYNRRTDAVITLPKKALWVYSTSMLEDEDYLIAKDCKEFNLKIKPYEIVTLKVIYKD